MGIAPTVSGCQFLEEETIIAGEMRYQTDRLAMNADGNRVEFNHIEIDCPECEAIGELAIELQTESLYCPVCDHRRKFYDTDLSGAVLIEDAEAE